MRILIAVILSALSFYCSAQIFPKENDTLNYRLTGFLLGDCNDEHTYKLEIANGSYDSEKDFTSHIFYTENVDSDKLIVTLPEFGKPYTWRVTCYNNKGKKKHTSQLHHFATGYFSLIDTSKARLQIVKNEAKQKDLLLFVDYFRTLYNLNGEPLWYLPNIPGAVDSSSRIRDLKPTDAGTITFLTDSGAFEVDYNGHVLWKAPNTGQISGNDTSEHYHHEFTRLSNGNYMVAGMTSYLRKIPGIKDTSLYTMEADVVRKDGEFYKRVVGSTLIEYTKDGKVVWTWKTSDLFNDDDLFTNTFPNGTVNPNTHMNSFYFNEKDSVIYLSFRDISRIAKIAYPSGKEIISYGESYVASKPIMGTGFFHGQHNIRLDRNGDMYLFNNNGGVKGRRPNGRNMVSYIVKLQEPNAKNNNSLTKMWQFGCDIDTLTRHCAITGGSVYELENKDIVVGMGNVNRIFIVTPDKKITWNALLQVKHDVKSDWVPGGSYRTSVIDNQDDLIQLVYKSLK